MSWKSRSKGDRTNRGSRPGTGASRGQPLHRWQDAASASQRSRAQSRRPFGRWILTAAVGLGLLGLLVYLFLKRERVTQVILVTATDYQLPAPLNPWAVEDGNALKGLEDENLWPVSDISDKWNKQPTAAALQELLDEEFGKSKEPLIVHISMHGVVNDENKPCLLPPGPSAIDAKTWIPVEDVLNQIDDAVGDERKALVILDCNRIRANWQLGIVYNTFTERLQQLLGSNPFPGVAVLCSAGPGQMNWASADLNGSSFGRYLQLGLAGEADNADGDGAVSLHELVAYLQREVNAWSEANRGEQQQPTLIPAGAADFHLTWNVRGFGTLAGYESALREQKRSEPTIPPADIEALWSQLDELRSIDSNSVENAELNKLQPLGLVRTDPLFCRDLELGVLRVEALSRGGLAYKQLAGDQFTRLKAKLSDAVKQKNRTTNSRAVADHLGYGKVDEWARIRTAGHSLPAAEYFGASDAESSKGVLDLWETLATPSAGESSSAATAGGQGGIAGDLAETQLLIAANVQGIGSLWPAGDAYALKSVLTRRNHAEELAVPRCPDGSPGDERAHYFARIPLKAADAQRRLAEDVLFIGPQSTQDYAELASAADELYDWTGKVMQEATSAYAVRDAAMAEAPYLGFWLCGPAIVNVQDRISLVSELLGLVRQGHDLDEQISQPERLDDADALPVKSGLPFSPLAGEVLKHHRSLKGAFKQKYEELLDKGAQGPDGWTALDCALTTPLIPADKRSELVAMRDEVSKNLFKEYFEKNAGAQATPGESDSDERRSAADADSESAYLRELQRWDSHPLVEILLPEENDKATNRDISWCDNVAKRLRERLSGLSSSKAGDPDSAKDVPGDDVIRDRQELNKAERALRAAAGIGFGLSGMKSDPVLELRQFDFRQLLVSQGERAMEDFWGAVSQAGVEDPFFVRAAKHYFDAARNLGTPTPAVRLHLDKLQVKLAELEKSKRQPLQIRANSELVNELRGDVAVKLEIAAKSSNYPPGQAAVYLRRESGQRLDFEFKDSTSAAGRYLKYPPPSARQNFMMAITGAPTDQAKVEAVSFFRGQEDLTSFILPTFKGLRIDYDPYVYDGQSITLFGDRPEQLSLVFILDSSSSMDEQTQIEALKANTEMRIELAKRNFASMLSDIVKRNREGEGTRVGVRFYGHRLGWIRDGDELAKQTDYKGAIPDNLTPSEDVELVQPLGRFDGGVANKVNELLNSLEPWGETPLYLSLMQALDDFNSDGAETRKSIIAITDGEDYQSLHNLNGPKPRQTTLNMLLAAWQRSKFKVPIHILGFDIAPNVAAVARAEYMQVARVTGGSYTEIKSGGDLLTQLREHLNVAGYTVKDANGRLVNSTNQNASAEVKLGTPVQIQNSEELPADFQVAFRNVPPKVVRVEGGEALELWVEKSGSFHNIVARDYDRRTPLQLANLRNGAGGPETDYILRVHLPVRSEESVVEFPISLQQNTRAFHFTPRPAETWLEVSPLNEASSGQSVQPAPYVFYDTNYVPNEPVPVLVWRAKGWQDWTKARISFWCKFRPTDPAFAVRLRDADYRDFQSVPDLSGVQLRVETRESGGVYQVYVVENHSAQSAGVDSLRIQFQTDPTCKPSHVQHQFDRNTRIATHSFEFPSSDRGRIESYDASQILITRASDIKEGALQISGDASIEISVQPAGVYHTTGGVSNGQ